MTMLKTCLVAMAATVALCFMPFASAEPIKNIVLVHGAWVDASGWKPVWKILTEAGFNVTMVQEPQTSYKDDVAATRRILDLQDGPTILVGHSYGGSIITEAGMHKNVVGLVYVAAPAPEVGKDEADLEAKYPSVLAKTKGAVQVTPDGFTYLAPEYFLKLFSPTVPKEEAEFEAHSQVLAYMKDFHTPVKAAAWKEKPVWGVVAGNDQIINPDLERLYYRRAQADWIVVPGASHSVYKTHSKDVAGVIKNAAQWFGDDPAARTKVDQVKEIKAAKKQPRPSE